MLPLRHFGVFTAVGIFVALIFALTFLPAVLVMLPPTVSRSLRRQMGRSDDLSASGWTARMLARLGRGVARRPLWVWAPTVLLMGVCLAGVQRIEVDTSWIRSFHPQSPVRIADEVLRDKFQGTLPTYVAIEGHAPDLLKDPDLLQKLDRLQAEIEKDPSVGGSLSIAEFLKRMNRVMNEDRLEMEVVPTSRDLVSQYLLLYSFSGDPDDFDEVVDYDYQHANVAFYLRSDSTQDILRVVHQIQDFAVREFGRATQSGGEDGQVPDPWSLRFGRWLSGVEPTIIGWETNSGFRIGFAGPGYFSHRFSELVVAGQISSLVASLVTVFLLTAIMFRSLTAGVINCIPISLVMIFGFGLMGLLNIPLEVGRSLTASMVIGSGIDYTIHFLNKYRVKVREGLTTPEDITVATMVTSGKAIFFNAVVVIGGYLVFLTSNFSPNFALGAMVALNMSACLLASMTVLPAVLNTFKPRFVYGMEKPAPLAVNPEYEA
jgi:predicted RND superfamily exporter protein